MNAQNTDTPNAACPSRRLLSRPGIVLLAGLLLGASAVALAGWMLMPGMMIEQHQSRFDLDETVEKLTAAARELGWNVPAVRNLNDSLSKQGVEFSPQVRLVEICREDYAESILTTNRELATLMPCAFAVYQGDDGKVYVSGVNTRLMGTMFGGNVADVMGGQVARDEAKILSSVVKGS